MKLAAGYIAAVLTVAMAVLAPFLWLGVFNNLLGRTTLKIDPIYTGGEPLRTLQRPGYVIQIYRPVPRRTVLATTGSFIQLVFKPAASLPSHVSESLDLDGDNHPDLTIAFDLPRDPAAPLQATLGPHPRKITRESLSSLIARIGDTIVLRVPLEN